MRRRGGCEGEGVGGKEEGQEVLSTYFWSSGKYSKARMEGSKNAASVCVCVCVCVYEDKC